MASYLSANGYTCVVRDMKFQSVDDLYPQIANGTIAIVGISMLSFYRKQAYEMINHIKTLNPDVKLIIGGIHASSIPEMLINNFPIDALVIGEGERTLRELCDCWLSGIGDIKDIDGLYTREYGMHKPRELIEDLDSLPFPDYAQVDMNWYHCVMARNRPHLTVNGVPFATHRYANISSSRGCIGRCRFCNAFVHWRGSVRFRTADSLFAEMELLYNKYGRNLFYFNDDAFGQDRNIVIDLCKKIVDSNMSVAWYADTRVDVLDDEMMYWMSKSGCFCLSLGVESGSQKVLDNINKELKVADIINAVSLCKKHNIKAYALLMIGNMGETDETIQETVNLMSSINIDLYSSLDGVWCLPQTVYENMMIKNGVYTKEYWLTAQDGAPYFVDNYTRDDLHRWNCMIHSIPQLW